MTAPDSGPTSSVGRYVRAVVGVLCFLGGIAVAVLLALGTTKVEWTGVALSGVLLGAGVLLTDPTAIPELAALVRAWRGGST